MTADERADEQLEHVRVGKLLDQAKAENERLREAITVIVDRYDVLGIDWVMRNARAALELPSQSSASIHHE